jgi:hypothetical protein
MAKPTGKTEAHWLTWLWELPHIVAGRQRKRFIKQKARRARRRAMQRIQSE